MRIETNDFVDLPVFNRGKAINKSGIEYTELNCNPLLGCSHRCTYCYSKKFDLKWKRVETEKEWFSPKIYTNFISLLKHELETGKVNKNKEIFIATMTDVYQPFAYKHKVASRIVSLLQEYNCTYRVLTKSPLIVNDALLYNDYEKGKVGLSITTNKENDVTRKQFEPGTKSIMKRLEALNTLSKQNIRLWISFEPFLPKTDFNSVFSDLIGNTNPGLADSIIEMEMGKMNYMGVDEEFNWPVVVNTIESWREKSPKQIKWHYKSQTQNYLQKHYPELEPIGGYP